MLCCSFFLELCCCLPQLFDLSLYPIASVLALVVPVDPWGRRWRRLVAWNVCHVGARAEQY